MNGSSLSPSLGLGHASRAVLPRGAALTVAAGASGTSADALRTSRAAPLAEHAKLQVRALRKTFGSFVALERADLDVREGEFVTLLGPSGSGKTTLLLAIAGLNEPDGGEIHIDGRLATFLPPHRRGIGMVFQNYALFPHMSVFENIAFPLRMRRMEQARIREAVQRVLAVIRLPEVAQRFPRQLSGGQQQRVALARALVYEPSIVLLDEPLGALDKKLREQLQLEIKRLHGELGLAMLYVTHDQEEALVMSDRICLMRDGRIEQLGTPEELYFRPHSLFAADFLGESNLLAGRVVDTEATMARVRLHDGIELRGVCGQPLEVGQRARVMIRPEAIRIADRAGPAEAGLRARLVESVMCGSTTKWFLRTASGAELKAQVLTGTFTGRGLPQGEVFLAWSDQSAVVLADE